MQQCHRHSHNLASTSGRDQPCILRHRLKCRGSGHAQVKPPRADGNTAAKRIIEVRGSQQGLTTGWRSLQAPLLWQGSEEDALASDSQFKELLPTWKVLLLSDGSVTRHLQLMTQSPVTVECLEMKNIGDEMEGLPLGVNMIAGPRVQRQVLLRPRDKPEQALVYASSWWNAAQVDEYLQDKSKPIWVSLSQGHVELYRDIQQVYYGNNPELEALLACSGPFWGRHYFFWHNGQPLTLIYEVFSNRLSNYLGLPY